MKTILLTLLLLFSINFAQEIDVTVRIENVVDLIGMSIVIGYNENAVELNDTDTTLIGTQVNITDLGFLAYSQLLAGIRKDINGNEIPGTLVIGYSSTPAVFNSGSGDCFVIKFNRISEEEDSIRFVAGKCRLESMLYEIPAEWWNYPPPQPPDTTRVILTKVISGIGDNGVNIITTNQLYQNYPNPFNATTVIEFDIKNNLVNVELSLYNNLGKKIKTLINEKRNSGRHKIIINTHNMASGIYFYLLKTSDGYSASKKMILIK